MTLEQFAATYLPLIDADLEGVLQRHDTLGPFFGMMRYHLGWVDESLQPVPHRAGKRLRPLLCLLACHAAGGDPERALPAASALELVHSFSLIHDDIEDGSRTRRGRPAVWDVWGTAQAINAGDGMLALARLAVLRAARQGLPAWRVQATYRALDSACLELCEGQYLDMSFEARADVGLPDYLRMIRLKTAALMAAASAMGALAAAGEREAPDAMDLHRRIERFRALGEHLGMAFQIQDDVLGIWGEEEVTGKPASSDLREKKKTLPVIHALSQGSEDAARIAGLYARSEPLGETECREVRAVLERSGSRAYAEETAAQYLEAAQGCVEELCLAEPARQLLAEFARSLLGRRA